MIKIQNIYYMLAYSYIALNEQGYKSVSSEKFENAADLLAHILYKGISKQIKSGLGQDYILKVDELSSPTGKIDINQSIKTLSVINKKLTCEYTEFSENIYINKVLKATINVLIKSPKVNGKNKKSLSIIYRYFSNVDDISLKSINRKSIIYNRNNSTYKMLIGICFLIIDGMIINENSGTISLSKYIEDSKLFKLFETFVLNYYKKHYTDYSVTASKIKWNITGEDYAFLPEMKSDITIQKGDKILIIDTKYYTKTMQSNRFNDKKKLHSNNLYQIFTYVKNKDIMQTGNVSGLLLYAKTDEDIVPNQCFNMGGNRVGIKTIDLGQDFKNIEKQLNDIISEFF